MVREILYREECYTIVGVCLKIHNLLGHGFKEIVYKDALEVELINAKIPYEREKRFKIEYEGVILRHTFIADFLVFKSIVLEIKATPILFTNALWQTLNYLKASQVQLGVVINFGENKLKFKRVICTY